MVNETVNYLMHPLESLFKGAATVSSNRERAHSLVSSECMGTVASSFHNLTHDTSAYIALHRRQFYPHIFNLPEAY